MSNFFPLIANAAGNLIQEIPANANLDLSQSGIANSGNITVATGSFYYGDGSQLSNITAANKIGRAHV